MDEQDLKAVVAIWGQVKAAFCQMAKAFLTAMDPWLKWAARVQWYAAQRTARTLSRHPDLVAMDGWLDRLYPNPLRT